MSQSFTKYVSENTAFAIDWENPLSNAVDGLPDTIATSNWQVPAGITKVSDSVSGWRAKIRVSGGTAEQTYTLENTITLTTTGYTLIGSITVLVKADPIP